VYFIQHVFADRARASTLAAKAERYGNGVIDRNLVCRYESYWWTWHYRNINSLLSYARGEFEAAERAGTLDTDIFGESDGDAFFTYSII